MNNTRTKNALITGASKGIGKAIAIELASQGINISINYNNSKTEAVELQAQLKSDYNIESCVIKGDVSNKEDCYNLVETSIAKFGSIDILVNNAGIIDDSLMIRMQDDAWEKVIRTNLNSIFYCTKPALKSIPPLTIIIVIANAPMPTITVCFKIVFKFCIDKKLSMLSGTKININPSNIKKTNKSPLIGISKDLTLLVRFISILSSIAKNTYLTICRLD